jgi:hypothetical protein
MCGWKCGDETPDHKHFAVSIRENGKLLGRLAPDGSATKRNIYAAILSESRAQKVTQEINEIPHFQAKVIPF